MDKIIPSFLVLSTLFSNILTDTWTVTKQSTYQPIVAYAQEVPQTPVLASTSPIQETCSCVAYVRTLIPSLPRGDAKNLETNSIDPILHGAVKLSYATHYQTNLYHLAYVEKVDGDGIHIVSDCKHSKHEIIREVIPLDSDLIQGYYSPSK